MFADMKEGVQAAGAKTVPHAVGSFGPCSKNFHLQVPHVNTSYLYTICCSAEKLEKHHSGKFSAPTATMATEPKLYRSGSAVTSDSEQATVAVCMGSDTDLETLKPGLSILDETGLLYEVHITSAHRTPQYMLDFAEAAEGRGLKVIIAAAGGSAHLPGMLASHTVLPVIGVPVKAKAFDGLDSLMSIVSMPRGIPVATMGVGNSTNAAILAARIVGTSDEGARKWVMEHLERMKVENMEKENRLQSDGWHAYKKADSKLYL